MPRKASSVSEIDQIVRVHSLLTGIGVCPSPLLEVVTASGQAFRGQILRDVVGNAQTGKGWHCYGSITLATQGGKIEIDYLDVATVALAAPPEKSRLTALPKTRARPRKKAPDC